MFNIIGNLSVGLSELLQTIIQNGPQLTTQRKCASGNSNGDAKNAEKRLFSGLFLLGISLLGYYFYTQRNDRNGDDDKKSSEKKKKSTLPKDESSSKRNDSKQYLEEEFSADEFESLPPHLARYLAVFRGDDLTDEGETSATYEATTDYSAITERETSTTYESTTDYPSTTDKETSATNDSTTDYPATTETSDSEFEQLFRATNDSSSSEELFRVKRKASDDYNTGRNLRRRYTFSMNPVILELNEEEEIEISHIKGSTTELDSNTDIGCTSATEDESASASSSYYTAMENVDTIDETDDATG